MGFELTTSRSPVHCSSNCAKSLFGCLCESLRPLLSHALLILEINKVPTSEMMHETKESSLQKSTTDSSLAQSVVHDTGDQEVMGSNPT